MITLQYICIAVISSSHKLGINILHTFLVLDLFNILAIDLAST
jgi:hypothetical protein